MIFSYIFYSINLKIKLVNNKINHKKISFLPSSINLPTKTILAQKMIDNMIK